MTVGEVKKVLEQVQELDKARKTAHDIADDFKAKLMSGKTTNFGNSGERYEKNGNPIEKAYDHMFKLEERAEKKEQDFVAAHAYAQELIDLVPNASQREVLERCYLMYQRFEEISEIMHYSADRIKHLKGYALLACAKQASKVSTE